MLYNIIIKAKVESDLAQNVIEDQLTITLNNTASQYSKFDGVNDKLEVTDYELTEASEICPHCEIELVSRMYDVDGTNLVEHDICKECGYGTPALI